MGAVVGGLVAALRIFNVTLVFVATPEEGKGLVKLNTYVVPRLAVHGVVAAAEALMLISQLLLATPTLKLMIAGKYTMMNPPLGTGLFNTNEK